MAKGVYLFLETGLAIPQETKDAEVLDGVDAGIASRAFGEREYYTAPPVPGCEADDMLPGFLLPPDTALPPGWRSFPVRQAAVLFSGPGKKDPFGPEDPFVGNRRRRLLRTYHVLQWRRDSVYCGSCGAPNGDSPSELARLCPRCGRVEYPRISPAVITLVYRDDGRALLAHNKKFKPRLYSLIAGFTEAGENLEAAAAREVKEEVNLEVRDIRYVTSQCWPFPNSLMVGFTARYEGGKLKCDGQEILDAQWFTRESVLAGTPELPGPGSVSRYIIDHWLRGGPE
ncbi:MAG: NAD(+) diphosphatase [Spirochaetaceae bacterium]|jgi:NAD+ diphosphatase|nr:NAD(+) diphosphatase [Spirochaetaceae bacterium]